MKKIIINIALFIVSILAMLALCYFVNSSLEMYPTDMFYILKGFGFLIMLGVSYCSSCELSIYNSNDSCKYITVKNKFIIKLTSAGSRSSKARKVDMKNGEKITFLGLTFHSLNIIVFICMVVLQFVPQYNCTPLNIYFKYIQDYPLIIDTLNWKVPYIFVILLLLLQIIIRIFLLVRWMKEKRKGK